VNELVRARVDRALQYVSPLSGLQLGGESPRIASFHHLSGAIFSHLDQDLINEILRRNQPQRTVRHALLALSVQLEAFARDHRTRDVDHTDTIYSLNHYGQSLKGVQDSLNNDTGIGRRIEMLFALSLIISYELLRGNGPAALTHLQGALCLLSAPVTASSSRDEDSKISAAIRIFYLRLEVGALSFVGSMGPRISTSSFDLISERAEYEVSKARLPKILAFQALRDKFFCLKFHALQAMSGDKVEGRSNYLCERDLRQKDQQTRNAVLADLQRWFYLFQPALDVAMHPRSTTDSVNPQLLTECRLLHIHYLILVMRLSSFCPEPRETSFDNFEASFDALIRHARTLVNENQHRLFTLDMGLIEPLYFTVLKCREPNKRLSALELLNLCRQEAAWDGPLMASVAHCVIRVEAALTTTDNLDELLPESANVSLYDSARAVWHFKSSLKAERRRVSAVALPSVDWGRRSALVEFYHSCGRVWANCQVSTATSS
jgi:hypothetical protein